MQVRQTELAALLLSLCAPLARAMKQMRPLEVRQ